ESRDAVLTVVASRGLGGFSSLLLGSTAVHLAAHGESPVLVLRVSEAGDGPDTVRQALAFAQALSEATAATATPAGR
ncbi:universal stress protein, partial [Streptomyces sp. McG5]|uniref:universal stress protein n=1 Tax=Streptomyces sp. McG5 TaxID=2725484 RepID=UPI0020370A17